MKQKVQIEAQKDTAVNKIREMSSTGEHKEFTTTEEDNNNDDNDDDDNDDNDKKKKK